MDLTIRPNQLGYARQDVHRERPIIILFNEFRDRIRNRFASKGNTSVSTPIPTVLPTTSNPDEINEPQEQLLDIAAVAIPPSDQLQPIESDFGIKESFIAPAIVPETTAHCKCEDFTDQHSSMLGDILGAVRINEKNILAIDSVMPSFSAKFEEIVDVLQNLNDQMATYNDLNRNCQEEKAAKLKKKAGPAGEHSNIIQLDIIKPDTKFKPTQNIKSRHHH